MRKYIMQELPSEVADFSTYFDDDGLKSVSGECNAVYINDGRHFNRGFNSNEYADIYSQLCDLIEGYDNKLYDSVEGLFEEYVPDISKEKYGELKTIVELCSHNVIYNEDIVQFLKIKTGKPWGVKSFCGYYQGDYCEVVYCEDTYAAESINEIGHMYLGCGSEFRCIYCDEHGEPTDDITYGYFAIDDLVWTEDSRLINHFAEYFECQPDEIEVQLFDGYIKTAKYKTVEGGV